MVNVAAICVGTRALGPGLRSVVWVQGCPFRCSGCIAPDWIPVRRAREVTSADLADELLAGPAVSGLTFTGGEPMAQAGELAEVARAARRKRDVSLICFTGYRLATLRAHPPGPGVADLLRQVDVLIDGLYIESRNDNKGMRGSDNQQVHHLTSRLEAAGELLSSGPRRSEIRLSGRSALLVGVPAAEVAAVFGRMPGAGREL
jgi:anaerobic ribonucleoside-triphosphate reductase activating protein